MTEGSGAWEEEAAPPLSIIPLRLSGEEWDGKNGSVVNPLTLTPNGRRFSSQMQHL